MINNKKFVLFELIPVLIAFIAIMSLGIYFGQSAIKLIPVCVSLIVMLFNARANRFGLLLGACNSLIYAIGYYSEGLYGTVISALYGAVVSFASFFLWKKRAYGSSTVFRRMKVKFELLAVAGFAVLVVITVLILYRAGGTEPVLDGFTMMLGLVLPVLTMFAFIEALPLNIANMIVSLTLWIRIVAAGNLADITYLVYSVYCTYMTGRLVVRWIKLYLEQQREAKRSLPEEKEETRFINLENRP